MKRLFFFKLLVDMFVFGAVLAELLDSFSSIIQRLISVAVITKFFFCISSWQTSWRTKVDLSFLALSVISLICESALSVISLICEAARHHAAGPQGEASYFHLDA
jgi:hypothetical protein